MHPNAPFVHRQGEVNAWDNADFRAAVEATGKKQIILAGIVTEVCASSLSLSLFIALPLLFFPFHSIAYLKEDA